MLAARFARFLSRFRRIQPHVGRLHALVLRLSGGRLRRSLVLAGGQPVLSLTTTGRRSGRERSTAVAYVRHGEGWAVGALNLGSDHTPAWCLNLRAEPDAWVEVEGRRRAVRAREATGEEADRLWAAFIARLPTIAHSRELARRDVPMIVLKPVSSQRDRAG
jgi:deazaflavin-dependent oxidoreductase (nitroreductase family)